MSEIEQSTVKLLII